MCKTYRYLNRLGVITSFYCKDERRITACHGIRAGARLRMDESDSGKASYRVLLEECWSQEPNNRPRMEGAVYV